MSTTDNNSNYKYLNLNSISKFEFNIILKYRISISKLIKKMIQFSAHY